MCACSLDRPKCIIQKNPRVRKIPVRNSGAGNGCTNFMDTWKNALFLQEKPMSIKFLVLGGGGYFGFWGGGGCRFYFYGRADFSELLKRCVLSTHPKTQTISALRCIPLFTSGFLARAFLACNPKRCLTLKSKTKSQCLFLRIATLCFENACFGTRVFDFKTRVFADLRCAREDF